jgi:hypothetical protein
MSSATVYWGLGELDRAAASIDMLPPQRLRKAGGGRKRATQKQPGLSGALEGLVEPTARGDPECALRWTCKSTYRLAAELRRRGFAVGPRTVAKVLKDQDFSLQANRKAREGDSHPDRDAQFAYINARGGGFQR